MKSSLLLLLILVPLAAGCGLFIKEYDPPECEGGIMDITNNLCWEDPYSESLYNVADATIYCETLVQGDHNDWRLPGTIEIFNLLGGCGEYEMGVDEVSCNGCGQSSVCTAIFGNDSEHFWTGDEFQNGGAAINIEGGYLNYLDNYELARARCVWDAPQ